MKKINTLFKKDPNNLGRVINEIDPANEWVFEKDVNGDYVSLPTRQFDGIACMIENYRLYKSVNNEWALCNRKNESDKPFFEALDRMIELKDGTYELIGPKIQGNPEGLGVHFLMPHGATVLDVSDFSFEGLRQYLAKDENDVEGIVFHHRVKKEGLVHLRYDLNKAGDIGHPQKVMNDMGIKFTDATPQSVADQWWFWNCESLPDKLPEYLSILNIENPMNHVGNGLSKEGAKMIIYNQYELDGKMCKIRKSDFGFKRHPKMLNA